MCFLPATFEIAAAMIFAPMIFSMTLLEAAILGAILCATSPAVVVPKMLKLMESGHGKKAGIPQILIAGSSVDDIYAIVIFASLMGMYGGGRFNVSGVAAVPITIVLSLVIGILAGFVLVWLFKKFHIRDTVKVMVILGAAFTLLAIESAVTGYVPMSGLLAAIALGGTILAKHEVLAKRLSAKFSKMWIPAELMLFVFFGAAVDIGYAAAGVEVVLFIFVVLLIRIAGVFICFIKTELSAKERVFCAVAYLPKATVQAALGGIPLAAGIASGNIILTITVLSILITAPLGAIGIDATYRKLLKN